MKTHLGHGKLVEELFVKKRDIQRLKVRSYSLPRLLLNSRQLCDLELLLSGAFTPLTGFMTEDEYVSVIEKMRLPNGLLWPIPVVLDIEKKNSFKKNDDIALCDEYGKSIAILTVSSIFTLDKKKEALKVYKTQSLDHFGVRQVVTKEHAYAIGGSVVGIDAVDRFDFIEHRFTPKQLHDFFKKNKWDKIIGFQTRNPLHKIHFELIKKAAAQHKAKVLLHPSVGLTKDGDIDYITRVRIYITLYEKYMKHFAKLSLLPLAMRMAGPKEALWHAIIRKNYGVTHFIIGRDHAGPGLVDGRQLYGPYEAQEFVLSFEKELGIRIVPFQELHYVAERKKYVQKSEIKNGETVYSLSGTKLRELVRNGEKIPSWVTFPETEYELKRGLAKEKKEGVAIFLTGLPSAGKSTIARILYYKLLELQDKKVTLLDGDVIRQNLSKGLGFSKEDRNTNIMRIGFVASEIVKHGGVVICSAVAPYEYARQKNRFLISTFGTYIEVYVATPLSVCKKRDVKGLYWKAKKGKEKMVTGLDDPYEKPGTPEIVINTVGKTAFECANSIIELLKDKLLLTL